VSITGSLIIMVSFVTIGPLPFVPIHLSLEVVIASIVFHGVGLAAVMVSGFGMAFKAAVREGFDDGLNTYALVSGLW